MASKNQTKQYKLCQWEPDDSVLREDFNADNLKLENALASLHATVTTMNAGLTDLEEKSSLGTYVYGHYAADELNEQYIILGFRPTVVIVMPNGGYYANSQYIDFGMANVVRFAQHLLITDTGFTAKGPLNYTETGAAYTLNKSPYIYIAFR